MADSVNAPRQYVCLKCGAIYNPADWCPKGHDADRYSDVMIEARARDEIRKHGLILTRGEAEGIMDWFMKDVGYISHETYPHIHKFYDRLKEFLK